MSSRVSSRPGNTGISPSRKPPSSRAIRAAASSSWQTTSMGLPVSSRSAAIIWALWMELRPVTAEAPGSSSPASRDLYSGRPRKAALSSFMQTLQ